MSPRPTVSKTGPQPFSQFASRGLWPPPSCEGHVNPRTPCAIIGLRLRLPIGFPIGPVENDLNGSWANLSNARLRGYHTICKHWPQTMRRRDFIKILAGSAAAPSLARAQQNERKRLIGVLMSYAENDPVAQAMVAAFRDGLAKLGWIESSNLRNELRWGAGSADKFKTFAKELVTMRPEVILVQGTVATGLLLSETRTIPVVFVNVADPIGSGFVGNLAHPGGNITGFMLDVFSQGG
jgi:hypothetical protein